MKTRLLSILIAIMSVAVAFGSTGTVNFQSFLKAAKGAAQNLENADGCSLEVTSMSDGVSLHLKSDQGEVTVSAPQTSHITLSEKNETDGSYTHTYSVSRIGKLTVISADDAYYSVELSNTKTHKHTSCEIDY